MWLLTMRYLLLILYVLRTFSTCAEVPSISPLTWSYCYTLQMFHLQVRICAPHMVIRPAAVWTDKS
jgi:hypothetical protein